MESEKKQICFVCTGNTCRSPMAEVIFNHFYAGDTVYAVSAGLAGDGSPISTGSAAALRGSGLFEPSEYANHVSRRMTDEIMEKSDMVITMSARHRAALCSLFPELAYKVTIMPFDIPDPYGGGAAEYELCYKNITAALQMMFGFPEEIADELDDM